MKIRVLSFLFGALVPLLCQPVQAQAGSQIQVIANPALPASDLSSADLRDIFTGTSSTLHSGNHVTPVLLKPGATHDGFLKLYVGRSDSAFRAAWRTLLFSGQGVMPRTFDTEAALVDYVAHTPGAVGYIARSTPHDGVKTLAVR